MLIRTLTGAALLALLATGAVAAVVATDTVGATVSAAPTLSDYVAPVVGTIFSLAAGWITALFHRWTGIKADQAAREALQSAAQNAAALVVNAAGSAIDAVSASSPWLAKAEAYVQASVPGALTHFGIKPGDPVIQNLILAKIEQMTAASPVVAAQTSVAGNVAAATVLAAADDKGARK